MALAPSTFNDLVTTDGQQVITTVRTSDGYLNATKMCQSGGKKKLFGHYLENKKTQEFIVEVSKATGLSKEQMILVTRGGKPQLQGTFVHPSIGKWQPFSFSALTHLLYSYSPSFLDISSFHACGDQLFSAKLDKYHFSQKFVSISQRAQTTLPLCFRFKCQ